MIKENKKTKKELEYTDPRKDITIYKEEATQVLEFRRLTPIEKKRIEKRLLENTSIDQTHVGFLNKEEIMQIESSINIVEKPLGLVTRLMDYQLYGISWMVNREK